PPFITETVEVGPGLAVAGGHGAAAARTDADAGVQRLPAALGAIAAAVVNAGHVKARRPGQTVTGHATSGAVAHGGQRCGSGMGARDGVGQSSVRGNSGSCALARRLRRSRMTSSAGVRVCLGRYRTRMPLV